MIFELHLIQNFAPSCLNRDDLNAPKECEFGGVRRARVSSQCLKRSIRLSPSFQENVATGVGTRTKLLRKKLLDRFEGAGKETVEAERVAKLVADAIGSGSDDSGRTKVALYLGYDEIENLVNETLARWEDLAGADATPAEEPEKKGRGKAAKKEKNPAQALAAEFQKKFEAGTKAADIALFGRMVAEATHFNVDAACQVAHAISTHRVAPEMDFFTAVDDLQPEGVVGAGMMGTQEFNSPCLYRYANIHLPQLARNLGGDDELARAAALAFARASVEAIPSAKQNSHAAINPPDFVLGVVRSSGQAMSLANAFERPIRTRKPDDSIVELSINALLGYWGRLSKVYGAKGIAAAPFFCTRDLQGAQGGALKAVDGLDEFLAFCGAALSKGAAS